MFLIVVICIVVLFFFLKNSSNKVEVTGGTEKTSLELKKTVEGRKKEIVPPFPFEIERKYLKELTEKQYESLYDRFENAAEKFEDAVADVEAEFTMGIIDYEARISALNNAIKEFDKCFNIVAPYWYEDTWFMETLGLEFPDSWINNGNKISKPKDVFEIDNNPEIYNYVNINFLRWLFEEYKSHKKEFLINKQEEKNNDEDVSEKIAEQGTLGELLKLKNKDFVFRCLYILSEKNRKEDVQRLTDVNFCKNNFNMYYSILQEVDFDTNNEKLFMDNCGHRRYYPDVITLFGKKYIVCNDWFYNNKSNPRDTRTPFVKWVLR